MVLLHLQVQMLDTSCTTMSTKLMTLRRHVLSHSATAPDVLVISMGQLPHAHCQPFEIGASKVQKDSEMGEYHCCNTLPSPFNNAYKALAFHSSHGDTSR